MEQHGTDPTTAEHEDPWRWVSSQFGSLGARLSQTYRQVVNDHGPTEEEIKDALATLAGAWSHLAESVASALRDPEVRGQLKDAAGSLATALGATLSQLGEEIGLEDSSEKE